MPQHVKGHWRYNLGPLARLVERALLVRGSPDGAVIQQENMLGRNPAVGPGCEAKRTLVGECDVTKLALAQADRDRAAIGVEG